MKQMFYGGVHPAEHKEATEQKPIQPLANAPAQVVIPMSMHIGAPCKPVEQKGDTVTVGQKIGETAGLGAPIHASVSGTVVAVEPRPGTGGTPTLSVVIENDFHDRKDLTPNVCAVYTEKDYRCKGIAGHLLNMVVEDMKSKGITPVYLVTDHTGFYERYGWEFLCMVQGDGEPNMTRMYIHR